jgi:radical SAM-linked protein
VTNTISSPPAAEREIHRYRVMYGITGRLRFLSHKELMRVMSRATRRARAPLAYSQGYHPHPLMSFGPPRPVGMAGTAELLDVRLTDAWPPARLATAVDAQLPPQITVAAADAIARRAPSITAEVAWATYEVHWPEPARFPVAALDRLLSAAALPFTRRSARGPKEVDLRPGIYSLSWTPPRCVLHLALSPTRHVRPQEVLALMTGWTDDELRRLVVTRTGLYTLPAATAAQETYGTRNSDRYAGSPGTARRGS